MTVYQSTTASSSQSIGAVIVLYQPNIDRLITNIEAVRGQVESLVIVDNSQPSSIIDGLATKYQAKLISNGDNIGIAQALNVGISELRRQGFKWAITLDQDTVLPFTYIKRLLEKLGNEASGGPVASLSGQYVDSDGSAVSSGPDGNNIVKYLITSANIVFLPALDSVGDFDSDYFIDYVDYDLSFKLRKAGWTLKKYADIEFSHQLGESQDYRTLGIAFRASNHNPLRRYYMTRNRIYFARTFFSFDPSFVLSDLFSLFKEHIKILVKEKCKFRKFRASLLGVVDSLNGHRGKCKHNI